MSIKKNMSRFSDRNKMRSMNAAGYSLQQIADKLSITPGHVTYCLEKWDADHEKARDVAKAREQANFEEQRRKNMLQAAPDMASIKAQMKAEIMAEIASSAKQPVPVEPAPDAQAENKDEAPNEEEQETEARQEVPQAPVRKRRKVA